MSLSLTRSLTGYLVIREVIRSISVRNAVTRSEVTLQPGVILTGCQIRKHSHSAVAGGAEPYVMEFEAADGRYECALATFQPRTRPWGAAEGAAVAI